MSPAIIDRTSLAKLARVWAYKPTQRKTGTYRKSDATSRIRFAPVPSPDGISLLEQHRIERAEQVTQHGEPDESRAVVLGMAEGGTSVVLLDQDVASGDARPRSSPSRWSLSP